MTADELRAYKARFMRFKRHEWAKRFMAGEIAYEKIPRSYRGNYKKFAV